MLGITLFFVTALPLSKTGRLHHHHGSSRTGRVVAKPTRTVRANLNINDTSDPERKDEISSKIEALRRQKRLKSQSVPGAGRGKDSSEGEGGSEGESEGREETDFSGSAYDKASMGSTPMPQLSGDELQESAPDNSIFSQLPDWKKEEVLQAQMQEAESFLNRGPSMTPSFPDASTGTGTDGAKDDEKDKDEQYNPKVSTWGVFPRPDNISRAYGGGRGIPSSGVDLDSEEQRARDEAVARKLASYRSARGVDTEKEAEHKDAIDSALSAAYKYMRGADPSAAARALEGVTEYVSAPAASRVAGNVWLQLALAYEACGKRDDAKLIYRQLRGNPYDEIARKAKQLLRGFEAMEELGFDGGEGGNESDSPQAGSNGTVGVKVMDFRVPDLNNASDKRYETVVLSASASQKSARPESVGLGVSIALFALVASPALLIALLVLSRQGH